LQSIESIPSYKPKSEHSLSTDIACIEGAPAAVKHIVATRVVSHLGTPVVVSWLLVHVGKYVLWNYEEDAILKTRLPSSLIFLLLSIDMWWTDCIPFALGRHDDEGEDRKESSPRLASPQCSVLSTAHCTELYCTSTSVWVAREAWPTWTHVSKYAKITLRMHSTVPSTVWGTIQVYCTSYSYFQWGLDCTVQIIIHQFCLDRISFSILTSLQYYGTVLYSTRTEKNVVLSTIVRTLQLW